MSSDAAISFQGVGKSYRIGAAQGGRFKYQSLGERVAQTARHPLRAARNAFGPSHAELFWALKDVSFDVQPGEVVGVIGRNGAGKSTLLKVLSQITKPTEGQIAVRGRVGSLLEVGTGFHPELTGRENVFLNGAILGMTRREVKRKFDEIVAFSEVERFLDTPVKQYSSGMYTRLAFAVAAHLDPEILVVDEVLAVGDAEFQKKCLGKMQDVAAGGRTVLFVSHNMGAVESLCDRAVLLDGGLVCVVGQTRAVVDQYLDVSRQAASYLEEADWQADPSRSDVPRIQSARLVDSEGMGVACLRSGDPITLELSFAGCGHEPFIPHLGVVCNVAGAAPLWWTTSRTGSYPIETIRSGTGILRCRLTAPVICPGYYTLDLFFGDERSDLDTKRGVVAFEVIGADILGTGSIPPGTHGQVYYRSEWELS